MISYDVLDRFMSALLGVVFLALAAAAIWILKDSETLRVAVFLVSSVMAIINLRVAITGK